MIYRELRKAERKAENSSELVRALNDGNEEKAKAILLEAHQVRYNPVPV